jgi:hypothetical protein
MTRVSTAARLRAPSSSELESPEPDPPDEVLELPRFRLSPVWTVRLLGATYRV